MQKRLGWRFNQRLGVPDWLEHRDDGLRQARKILVTRPQNLIKYHPMWEGNGVISFDNSPRGNNGIYAGLTLAQPGIGDGRYSAFFDGANDDLDVISAGFAADFDGTLGAQAFWVRPNNAGVWTDGATRYFSFTFVDGNNYNLILKDPVNNRLIYIHRAGGISETIVEDGVTTTNFTHIAITWDKAGVGFSAYRDGAQIGASQPIAGVFAGVLTGAFLGSGSPPPAFVWHGFMQHAPYWNAALTQPEIAFLAER